MELVMPKIYCDSFHDNWFRNWYLTVPDRKTDQYVKRDTQMKYERDCKREACSILVLMHCGLTKLQKGKNFSASSILT